MSSKVLSFSLAMAAFLLSVVACQDADSPVAPLDADPAAKLSRAQAAQQQRMAELFRRAAPEVLALPQTVFADHDEAANRLVFGVEHAGVARGVEAVLSNLGVPGSAYEVKLTEPIRFMATLRETHRPTVGGIQIHFGSYFCTLGFSVDHSGGRSFITNSHCTDRQGATDGTAYYQPTSSVDPNAIAFEVDDPAYFRGGECPRGRKCRYSDAARALYQSGVVSLGVIARTSGPNNGSLEMVDKFDISSQDNTSTTFSGTLNKVGRTTGWTRGAESSTCATVNVSGSNITLLCQTLVENDNYMIVGGGDSGSPVFVENTDGTVRLVGILWGGNSSGTTFVFSPLSQIQAELGSLDATTDGTGGGGGTGNSPPTASFKFSCTNLTCNFDGRDSFDSDGTISSYAWTFGDGSTGSGIAPSHSYSVNGTYTVTLTVTDDAGATGSASQDVTVADSDGGGGVCPPGNPNHPKCQ